MLTPTKHFRWTAAMLAVAITGVSSAFADDVAVTALTLDKQPAAHAKVNTSFGGAPLTVGGKKIDEGVGTSGASKIVINLDRAATRFKASVAIDDETPAPAAAADGQAQTMRTPTATVMIYGDDRRLWPMGNLGGGAGRFAVRGRALGAGNPPEDIDIDLTGVRVLSLEITPPPAPQGRRGAAAAPPTGHVDWLNPMITYTGTKPEIPELPAEEKMILTPKELDTPRINGAKVFGVRPGHPFIFTVPVTGQRPMEYSAEGLPDGLKLDPATGFISGRTQVTGDHVVKVHVKNALGSADSTLKIVVGDTIDLTPQLGWNSWNCFGPAVTGANIMAAADSMSKTGLVNHGWTYINIDDYWEYNDGLAKSGDPTMEGVTPRKEDGTINTNKRFPDMKALTDHIHALGLKAGIYSGPGPTTCGGCTASYQHEEQDAKSYADWGFDYLKYDQCSYVPRVVQRITNQAEAMKPYQTMQAALKKQDRDILYSLCQYGGNNVWTWGAQVDGNSWRVTGDITDTWASLTGIWDQQTERGNQRVDLYKYAGPGHWNDVDMMIIGQVSVASGRSFHPTNLTPNEQYTHVTAWILMDAPMLIGCDMTKFDDFTLSLLTNDEVLAVSQDPLGKAANRIVDKMKAGGFEVWAKDMEDGSKAVGIFNRSELEGRYTLQLADVGLSGKQTVRDLWRQQDVATADGKYEVSVPRHGVLLLKLSTAK